MESTKTRILKKLLETDGYLSGQELCEQLGVSRTAVWKYMKQLKEEGYEIEAVQNKGYCLKDVPDVLGESEIKSRLHTRWAGQTLYYYDEIDSTNTQIKRLAEEDAPHGTLAVADYQSRGKGRRGRAWDSPHGSAIYMSILIHQCFLIGSHQSAQILCLYKYLIIFFYFFHTFCDQCRTVDFMPDLFLQRRSFIFQFLRKFPQIGINSDSCRQIFNIVHLRAHFRQNSY